ncbi:MAG: acyloxyacyl hydrolase [Bacteroidota bacterium]
MKQRKAFTTLLLFLCTLLMVQILNAQKEFPNRNHSWNLGYSVLHEQLPEGAEYVPTTLLGNYTLWTLKRFTIYGESQLTQASSPFRSQIEFEFGVNFGLRYRFIQAKNWILEGAIGAGPHYITIETRRQANGFIFSDNFELGTTHFFKGINTGLNFKLRYRHISNAGLKNPNGGIDNLFVVMGITSVF